MGRKSRLISWARSGFRAAAPATAGRNLRKTLVQTAGFWAVFLLAVPAVLVRLESSVGLARFTFPTQTWSPWLACLVASLLGLWSGSTMAIRGQGTPLPVDCPRRLVVEGPYRHVRNPMAMAGLLQGTCVGLGLGSSLTLLYVVLGGAMWNLFVRPVEEQDLEDRFGEEFLHYRDSVRCWIPRRKPYPSRSR